MVQGHIGYTGLANIMVSKYPPSIKIPMPEKDSVERKSSLLYAWFQHQMGIEDVERKIKCLELELEAYRKALKERIELTKSIEEEVTGIKELSDEDNTGNEEGSDVLRTSSSSG